jgi:hypothetical protein
MLFPPILRRSVDLPVLRTTPCGADMLVSKYLHFKQKATYLGYLYTSQLLGLCGNN